MADLPIDEQMMAALRAYAQQTGRTPEEVAREAIEDFLRNAGHTAPLSAEDEFLALAGIGHSGQHDVSERADEILREETDPRRGWTFNRDRTD